MKKFDIAIIGGGILGTTISYWISNLYDSSICVIEKEFNVAKHTSGRNTGVVHTPFYLNPEKKKILPNLHIYHMNYGKHSQKILYLHGMKLEL